MNDLRNTISDVSRITNQYSGRMNRDLAYQGAEYLEAKAQREAVQKAEIDAVYEVFISDIYDDAKKEEATIEDGWQWVESWLEGKVEDAEKAAKILNELDFVDDLDMELYEKRMYIK